MSIWQFVELCTRSELRQQHYKMNSTTTFYSATSLVKISNPNLFLPVRMEWNGQYNHRPTNDAIEQPTLIHLSLIMYFLFLRICYTCSCMFFLFHSLSLSLSLFLHWQKIFQINWRCIIQAGVAGSEMFRRWNFVEKPNKNEAKEKSQKEKIPRGKHFRGEIIVHKKTIIGGEFS